MSQTICAKGISVSFFSLNVTQPCQQAFKDPQQARIEELERLAGKLSLELEVAKKAFTLLPRGKQENESWAAKWAHSSLCRRSKIVPNKDVDAAMKAICAQFPRYAKRLMRTIKEEEVDLSDYQDYYDTYQQIGRFLEDVYMHKRVHSSLHYLTPTEFETQWLSATLDSRMTF